MFMRQTMLAVLNQTAAVSNHSCDPLFSHGSLASVHFVWYFDRCALCLLIVWCSGCCTPCVVILIGVNYVCHAF